MSALPCELQDVYFQPDYVSLDRTGADARALLLVHRRGEEIWACPFLLRPIPRIADASFSRELFDAETAYGYGGPVSTSEDPDFLAESNRVFSQWLAARGVVVEFIRLHPLLGNQRWLTPEVEVIRDRETVSMNLEKPADAMTDYDGKARNMVRRAERAGVRVVECVPSEGRAEFAKLYEKTMDRLDADAYYYFGEVYFRGLAGLAERSGSLLAAVRDDRWVAAAFFLRGANWLHYHLSATDLDLRLPGATNLILHAAAQLGRRWGLKRLHLGGGRTKAPDDPLLKFKRSMGTDSHVFRIG
ncbi:MAG TPA: GNAT family N-acetyltransferase, partial [Sumerlaeia bacterium]|nr:GNAT family N-acetyltransferase [Sumerlaeia bacterium]